ncbi:hypothetical protein IFM89_032438 [Coptis chinensis]|uniref:Uncharacterized protein n=1 Tax=Coptis chinensis TaxID=261450 RepID=A0A835LX26_9MAGN|nr:hypothetical protein IFM89_032438 [Coptis chinensis]
MLPRTKLLKGGDAPSSILQVNKLNDPEAVRKRSKLMLQRPLEISDHELEEIAKMGYASDLVLKARKCRKEVVLHVLFLPTMHKLQDGDDTI